jgi:hypothetical protein
MDRATFWATFSQTHLVTLIATFVTLVADVLRQQLDRHPSGAAVS